MEPVRAMRREHLGMLLAFGITMAFWLTQAWQRVAYLNDDLILFHLARQGLSRHLLFYNLFEHFSPIDHLFYWFELHLSPFDPRVGTAIIAVILLFMLCCLNWLLCELQVIWPLRAAAVVLLGTSFVTLVVTTWWGQGVYIPVALSAALLVMAAHVRGWRLRQRRWHVAACGFAVLGVLISERTLFTPGYLVLLDLAIAMRAGSSIADAVRVVWSKRWSLAPLFAISLAGAAFIRVYYYMAFPSAHLSDVARLIGVAYAKWFLPSLAGFYSQAGVADGIAVALAVGTATACVLLIAADRANLGAIALFAVAFIIDYGFLGIGRLGLYSINAEAGDIQYVAWILPLFAIAVTLLRLPVRFRARLRGAKRPAMVLVALAAAAVLGNVAYVAHTSDAFRIRADGYHYWINLRDGRPQWSSPSTAVLPLAMPIDLAALFVDPYGRMEVLLPEIDKTVHVGLHDVGSTTVVIDASGNIRVAALRDQVALTAAQFFEASVAVGGSLRRSGAATCFSATSAAAYVQLSLPQELTGDPLMVELSYTTSRASSIHFTSIAGSAVSINPLVSPAYAGAHTGIYLLEGRDVAQLQISGVGSGSDFCMSSLSVVDPLVLDANHACHTVDRHGEIGDVTPCPRPT
jgi:hypothetical protein